MNGLIMAPLDDKPLLNQDFVQIVQILDKGKILDQTLLSSDRAELEHSPKMLGKMCCQWVKSLLANNNTSNQNEEQKVEEQNEHSLDAYKPVKSSAK